MDFGNITYVQKKALLVIVVAIILGGIGYYWVESNREFVALTDEQLEELGSTRAVVKYYERLEKAYANDTFGGSTPEETLASFVEALREGDIETASKYYLFGAQELEKESLEEFSSSDKYSNWIETIAKASLKEKNKEEAKFQYSVVVTEARKIEGTSIEIPAGEYKNSIIIVKNSNGVWKIYEL